MKAFARTRTRCRRCWQWIRPSTGAQARLHGLLTLAWAFVSLPLALAYGDKVMFVAWLSLYAIVCGHGSWYQSLRVERRQEQEAEP